MVRSIVLVLEMECPPRLDSVDRKCTKSGLSKNIIVTVQSNLL